MGGGMCGRHLWRPVLWQRLGQHGFGPKRVSRLAHGACVQPELLRLPQLLPLVLEMVLVLEMLLVLVLVVLVVLQVVAMWVVLLRVLLLLLLLPPVPLHRLHCCVQR